MLMKNIWKDGMMGLVTGDALGLPIQFMSREKLKEEPVETMLGYGTFRMPPGTWSDDSSMALATMTSFLEKDAVDYDDIMKRFIGWFFYAEYTTSRFTFDQGKTCTEAILNYAQNRDYKTCGKTGERANGNGALMRILPACLYAYQKLEKGEWTLSQAVGCVHQISALTHNHLRSQIACGFYFFMVKNIIDAASATNASPSQAVAEPMSNLQTLLQAGIDDGMRYYHTDIANYVELAYYGRLFHLDEFAECPEEAIRSTGYVVDSFEAAIWCLITTDTLKDALLKAVNLGDDTDTVAAIAGGLAGLYYGYDAIPKEWREAIIKHDEIVAVCEEMKALLE